MPKNATDREHLKRVLKKIRELVPPLVFIELSPQSPTLRQETTIIRCLILRFESVQNDNQHKLHTNATAVKRAEPGHARCIPHPAERQGLKSRIIFLADDVGIAGTPVAPQPAFKQAGTRGSSSPSSRGQGSEYSPA